MTYKTINQKSILPYVSMGTIFDMLKCIPFYRKKYNSSVICRAHIGCFDASKCLHGSDGKAPDRAGAGAA